MASEQLQNIYKLFHCDGRDVADIVDDLDGPQFDQLPMGAILLDSKARILRYNLTEGELTNRSPSAVISANFFLDLAVCGVSDQFQGRFKEAARALEYDQVFPYVFHHKMPESSMLVRMTKPRKASKEGAVWVFVRRIMPPVPTH
jgi:photoactive yellow protein